MAALNKVMLIGNAGRDPEIHYHEGNGQEGSTGLKSATFTLATTERYRDRQGEVRETTEWHNIVAWRNNADIIEKYVHKGSPLYIEGRLRTRSWTDANGVKKYQTEIEVSNMQLLGRRDDSQQQGGYQAPAPATAAPAAPAYQAPAPAVAATTAQQPIDIMGAADAGSDDLPF